MGEYNVTVASQPSSRMVCSVKHGDGIRVSANVNNIQVICSRDKFTVGGKVFGIFHGQKVVLIDNHDYMGAAVVKNDGSFVFENPIAKGGSYNVMIATQPKTGICTVNNGSGENVISNINNVQVICTWTYSFLGNDKKDGAFPVANLIMDGNGNLYGTTKHGGGSGCDNGCGTVFKITDYGVEKILHSFHEDSIAGVYPLSGLLMDVDGTFYGTTSSFGITPAYPGQGGVFKLNSFVESAVYTFANQVPFQGMNPASGLIKGRDGKLYGTTQYGGLSSLTSKGNGIVFSLTTSGIESIVHIFGKDAINDGANPVASLIQDSDGTFYGTTESGGAYNLGTVFKLSEAGAETILYSFKGINSNDGSEPKGALVFDKDGNLYGTTYSGGTQDGGTVFKISKTGQEQVIYSFQEFSSTYEDGVFPASGLILASDGNFYGTTSGGGEFGNGSVYKITPSGLESLIHSFGQTTADGRPLGSLLEGKDGILYGTVRNGGVNLCGSVFSLKAIYK